MGVYEASEFENDVNSSLARSLYTELNEITKVMEKQFNKISNDLKKTVVTDKDGETWGFTGEGHFVHTNGSTGIKFPMQNGITKEYARKLFIIFDKKLLDKFEAPIIKKVEELGFTFGKKGSALTELYPSERSMQYDVVLDTDSLEPEF